MRLLRVRDFPRDERQAILEALTEEARAAWRETADALCREAQPAAEAMARVGAPLPGWLRALCEDRWSARVAAAFEAPGGLRPPAAYAALVDLADLARHLGIRLDLEAASRAFGQGLLARLEAAAECADTASWQEVLAYLHLASHLSLALPERSLQDRLFRVVRRRVPDLLETVRGPQDPGYTLVSTMLTVAAKLHLCTEEARARLQPLEESLAHDPAFWP
jgi:hypothetical protein